MRAVHVAHFHTLMVISGMPALNLMISTAEVDFSTMYSKTRGAVRGVENIRLASSNSIITDSQVIGRRVAIDKSQTA